MEEVYDYALEELIADGMLRVELFEAEAGAIEVAEGEPGIGFREVMAFMPMSFDAARASAEDCGGWWRA